MNPDSLRDRWRVEVFRSAAINDGTRVLLLALAEGMDGRGYVSTPRLTLALRVGKSERKVSQRLQEAVAARLLDRVQRGHKGTTATYRALLPDAVRVTTTGTLTDAKGCRVHAPFKGDPGVPAMHAQRVNPGGPTSSKPDHQNTEPVTADSAQGRKVSDDQEEQTGLDWRVKSRPVVDHAAEAQSRLALVERARESWGMTG